MLCMHAHPRMHTRSLARSRAGAVYYGLMLGLDSYRVLVAQELARNTNGTLARANDVALLNAVFQFSPANFSAMPAFPSTTTPTVTMATVGDRSFNVTVPLSLAAEAAAAAGVPSSLVSTGNYTAVARGVLQHSTSFLNGAIVGGNAMRAALLNVTYEFFPAVDMMWWLLQPGTVGKATEGRGGRGEARTAGRGLEYLKKNDPLSHWVLFCGAALPALSTTTAMEAASTVAHLAEDDAHNTFHLVSLACFVAFVALYAVLYVCCYHGMLGRMGGAIRKTQSVVFRIPPHLLVAVPVVRQLLNEKKIKEQQQGINMG